MAVETITEFRKPWCARDNCSDGSDCSDGLDSFNRNCDLRGTSLVQPSIVVELFFRSFGSTPFAGTIC